MRTALLAALLAPSAALAAEPADNHREVLSHFFAGPATVPEPPRDLDAIDLVDGFSVNELLAREIVKERQPIVAGKVKAVYQGTGEEIIVLLQTRSPFQKLRIHMGADARPVAIGLGPGDPVRVACKDYSGWKEVDGSGCKFAPRERE